MSWRRAYACTSSVVHDAKELTLRIVRPGSRNVSLSRRFFREGDESLRKPVNQRSYASRAANQRLHFVPAAARLGVSGTAAREPRAFRPPRVALAGGTMAAVDDPKTLGRARLSFASETEIDEFAATLDRFERGELTAEQWRIYRLVPSTTASASQTMRR